MVVYYLGQQYLLTIYSKKARKNNLNNYFVDVYLFPSFLHSQKWLTKYTPRHLH